MSALSFASHTARITILAFALTSLATLSACGSNDGESADNSVSAPQQSEGRERGRLFGGGFGLFGGGDDEEPAAAIGVNSYLWRASLDTINFMPLQSADPFGGVIISDWHEDPNALGERFKVTIYILDQRLRADGIKVAVFRQENKGNRWVDAPVNAATAIDIENAILTRARQLRIDSLGD